MWAAEIVTKPSQTTLGQQSGKVPPAPAQAATSHPSHPSQVICGFIIYIYLTLSFS